MTYRAQCRRSVFRESVVPREKFQPCQNASRTVLLRAMKFPSYRHSLCTCTGYVTGTMHSPIRVRESIFDGDAFLVVESLIDRRASYKPGNNIYSPTESQSIDLLTLNPASLYPAAEVLSVKSLACLVVELRPRQHRRIKNSLHRLPIYISRETNSARASSVTHPSPQISNHQLSNLKTRLLINRAAVGRGSASERVFRGSLF